MSIVDNVRAVRWFCYYVLHYFTKHSIFHRQPALFRRRASGVRNGTERSYKQYSHYESVHCDKAQGPDTRRESLTKSVLKTARSVLIHGRHDVWNHRQLDCLLKSLLGLTWNMKYQSSVLLSLCEGNPPMTDGFPVHRASNVESVSIP